MTSMTKLQQVNKSLQIFEVLFYFNVFVRILWFRFQPQKIARQNSKEPKLNTIHGSRTRTRNLNHRKSNLASIAGLISGDSKESC